VEDYNQIDSDLAWAGSGGSALWRWPAQTGHASCVDTATNGTTDRSSPAGLLSQPVQSSGAGVLVLELALAQAVAIGHKPQRGA